MPHQIPGLRPKRKIPKYVRRKQDVSDGCAGLLAVFVAFFLFLATRCGAQPERLQFRSLFQVEYTEADITLYHGAYNVTVNLEGIEVVPINPKAWPDPPVRVQYWTVDGDVYVGHGKGAAVRVYTSPEPYIEISTSRRTTFFYNQAPAKLVLQTRGEN